MGRHAASRESGGEVAGDAYAVLAHPFAKAGPALADPEHRCEILLLSFNTKQCNVTGARAQPVLNVRAGRKNEESAEHAYPVAFRFRVAERSEDLLRVERAADQGPFSTRDYRIVLAATPLKDGRTFLHFGYSYGFGLAGRVAMQTYLSTSVPGRSASACSAGTPAASRVTSAACAAQSSATPCATTSASRPSWARWRRRAPSAPKKGARLVCGDRALPALAARDGRAAVPRHEAQGVRAAGPGSARRSSGRL